MNIAEMVNVFAKLRPNATFVNIIEYTNQFNELSNFNIIFHIDYLVALRKSLSIVLQYEPFSELEKQAKREVISSITGSIDSILEKPLEEQDAPYIYFKDLEGNYIKGIKAHKDTNDLYMFGFVVSKKVIIPGEYGIIDCAPLTRIKYGIKSQTPISKFRQFKLIPKSYKEIKVGNILLK